jgi:hypothetical protein
LKYRIGFGETEFVLGYGTKGTFGSVGLAVQTLSDPGCYSIRWHPSLDEVDPGTRSEIERTVERFLLAYITEHQTPGLCVTLLNYRSDNIRRNDHERATLWALYRALEDLGLPVPPIKIMTEGELRGIDGRVPASYSLDQLLTVVAEENIHQEQDFGEEVGKEVC